MALFMVSWTAPTHNTDGSLLTNLDGFVCYRAQSFAELANSPVVEVGAMDRTCVLADLPGTWYVGVKARNTQDIYSAFSEIKTVTAEEEEPPPPPPPPPEEGPVVINTKAVEIRFGNKGPWIARKVGTVPLGTACIGGPLIARSGQDYYEVPRSAVKLTVASVRTTSKIAALCN